MNRNDVSLIQILFFRFISIKYLSFPEAELTFNLSLFSEMRTLCNMPSLGIRSPTTPPKRSDQRIELEFII